MVVKNVTGLDMAKLLIGSLGTLACIAAVNFKVFPMPERVCTFGFSCASLESVLEVHRAVVKSVLQPLAVDLLNEAAARSAGFDLPGKYLLLVESGGNSRVIERCRKEWEDLALGARAELAVLPEDRGEAMWRSIRELTCTLLTAEPATFVVRVSGLLSSPGAILNAAGECPALLRAGSGVGYFYCAGAEQAGQRLAAVRAVGLSAIVEHAPLDQKQTLEPWPDPGPELETMRRIKQCFDPGGLLNRGRLLNRI
jgi:glycolate oxidase FAD binding subunit